MIPEVQINKLISKLNNQINITNDRYFERDTVKQYIDLLDQYPKIIGYKYRSEPVLKFCKSILNKAGTEHLEFIHKRLLLQLINRGQSKIKTLNMPELVKKYYIEDFGRIYNAIEKNERNSGYYLYSNDRFYKDLAICRLHLFPIGARKYELSKFPLRRIIGNGWIQFIKVAFFLTLKTRGIKPFLTGHYDTDDPNFMKTFNVRGFIYTYRLIAEVMKLNPEIKGFYGINWLNDPKIERISPHLAYIRYFNIASGCTYFYLGTNRAAVKNATVKSASRRKLYQLGKYQPQNYAFAFTRKQLVNWLNKMDWYWD